MLILMGVYNGEKFLAPQLESLLSSGCKKWTLWASDDGSTDNSIEILKDFAKFRAPPGCRVVIRIGPRSGFAENYLSLLESLPDIHGHVALADQDDIWLPKRLRRAAGMLARIPPHIPAFVCGKRLDWSPERRRMRLSALPVSSANFANSLVENVAFGNTIVLNRSAARIARSAASVAKGIYSHDWWLYQILTGAGAVCLIDKEPSVLYRQHDKNSIGAACGAANWISRKVLVLRGAYARRVDAQLQGLEGARHLLLPENRELLDEFIEARRAPFRRRLGAMRATGVYRQTFQGRVGFWSAVTLGKV